MKDAALAILIRRILSAKTRGAAEAIAGATGADYSELIWAIINRLTWKRTLNQNSTLYLWISEIAKHTGETDLEVRRRIKLVHGCKILCRDDPEFLAFCQKALKPLSYGEMLEAMDFVSVTSLMNTKQFTELMNEIERTYRAQGVPLTEPDKEAAA